MARTPTRCGTPGPADPNNRLTEPWQQRGKVARRTFGGHALADRARLPLADLEPLAVFLCGPRWQTALARRINRSPRLVRRWVAGDRPIDLDKLAERRPAAASAGRQGFHRRSSLCGAQSQHGPSGPSRGPPAGLEWLEGRGEPASACPAGSAAAVSRGNARWPG